MVMWIRWGSKIGHGYIALNDFLLRISRNQNLPKCQHCSLNFLMLFNCVLIWNKNSIVGISHFQKLSNRISKTISQTTIIKLNLKPPHKNPLFQISPLMQNYLELQFEPFLRLIPVCIWSPICSSDIVFDFPLLSLTLAAEGKQDFSVKQIFIFWNSIPHCV